MSSPFLKTRWLRPCAVSVGCMALACANPLAQEPESSSGRKVTTTANDGYHGDWIWFPTGSTYTYKVCQAGSTTACSPPVTVTASATP